VLEVRGGPVITLTLKPEVAVVHEQVEEGQWKSEVRMPVEGFFGGTLDVRVQVSRGERGEVPWTSVGREVQVSWRAGPPDPWNEEPWATTGDVAIRYSKMALPQGSRDRALLRARVEGIRRCLKDIIDGQVPVPEDSRSLVQLTVALHGVLEAWVKEEVRGRPEEPVTDGITFNEPEGEVPDFVGIEDVGGSSSQGPGTTAGAKYSEWVATHEAYLWCLRYSVSIVPDPAWRGKLLLTVQVGDEVVEGQGLELSRAVEDLKEKLDRLARGKQKEARTLEEMLED